MASAVFSLAAQKLLSGSIDLTTDNIKASLWDMSDDGTAITGATNATPIVVTATAHGLTNGDRVFITGVGGNTAANGVFLVASADTNTFALTDVNGNNVAGNGAYTSGGVVVSLDVIEFYDDLTAPVAASGNLGTKTVTDGIFDAADVTINSVSGDAVDGVVIWKDTATPSTSPVIAVVSGTVTPDGNNVNITWDASGIFAIT